MTRRKGTTDPFRPTDVYVLRGADLDALWERHRDAWIAWHQSVRGEWSMPQRWWDERGVLVADDPAEPLDVAAYSDPSGGYVSPKTADELARARRLAERRKHYLMEHDR